MTISNAITNRRTIRKFKNTPIKSELLTKYINNARLAPSAANLQPLKYIVVESADMCEKLFPLLKWAGYLGGAYTPNEEERPTAYIIVCGDTSIRQSGYETDAGAAIENIILSALEDGIGTCWIASVDREETSKLLKLPQNLVISSVIALGYPAETPKEVEMSDGDVKYYLQDGTLCVPKRSMDEILLKVL
jgi:nitroreductase